MKSDKKIDGELSGKAPWDQQELDEYIGLTQSKLLKFMSTESLEGLVAKIGDIGDWELLGKVYDELIERELMNK